MEQSNKMEPIKENTNLFDKVDNIMSKVDSIPDSILNTLTQRSLADAKNIFNDDITLEKVTYAIYRAYVLGIAVGAEKKEEIFN